MVSASSLYLLSSKGHSYVGVNEDGPVGAHGHPGHQSRVHAGKALGLVDTDVKACPWSLGDHTPRKHEVPGEAETASEVKSPTILGMLQASEDVASYFSM